MYHPLRLNEFRLLTIHPSNSSTSEITCILSPAPLNTPNTPPYSALSYTWGPQHHTHTITIISPTASSPTTTTTTTTHTHPIPTNLHQALHHLRTTHPLTIWIDALCINQLSPTERTTQVKLMHEIYTHATQVLIWLGPETQFPTSTNASPISVETPAFDLLAKLQAIYAEYGKEHGGDLPNLDFQLTGPTGRSNPGFGLPDTHEAPWLSLCRVLSKPYFTRTWVIQEVVLANPDSALVLCGNLSVSWTVLRDFALSVRRGGSVGNLEYEGAAPGVVGICVMADLQEARVKGFGGGRRGREEGGEEGIELLELLVRTRGYEVSVEVDKVFGVIGLASDGDGAGVVVDYSLQDEAWRVWEGVAVHSLVERASLLCLSNAGVVGVEVSGIRRPSWIPVWSHANHGLECLALYGKGHFAACGEENRPDLRISEDHRVLEIVGYVVDKIAHVAPSLPPFVPKSMKSGPLDRWLTGGEEIERSHAIASMLMGALSMGAQACLYPNEDQKRREVARMLCCDTLITGEKAEVEGAVKVLVWILEQLEILDRRSEGQETHSEEELRDVDARKPVGVRMEEFMHAATAFGAGRWACATERGDLGRVPIGTKVGDLVVLFKGGIVPFLLRKHEAKDCYRLVGECFVNGIMYGEAMEGEDLVEKSFIIR